MAERTGKFRNGEPFSVRLEAETAAELRWAAAESRTPVSELLRRGLRPILAVIRAGWYEKHGSEDDWEEVTAVQAVTPHRLDSSFGVRLGYEQVVEIGDAARACGVTISAYLREAGLALAAAQRAGGTAQCPHLSVGPVRSAECAICGPVPVQFVIPGG